MNIEVIYRRWCTSVFVWQSARRRRRGLHMPSLSHSEHVAHYDARFVGRLLALSRAELRSTSLLHPRFRPSTSFIKQNRSSHCQMGKAQKKRTGIGLAAREWRHIHFLFVPTDKMYTSSSADFSPYSSDSKPPLASFPRLCQTG